VSSFGGVTPAAQRIGFVGNADPPRVLTESELPGDPVKELSHENGGALQPTVPGGKTLHKELQFCSFMGTASGKLVSGESYVESHGGVVRIDTYLVTIAYSATPDGPERYVTYKCSSQAFAGGSRA
jgi:hypothetical protein